jgi:small-conductance mechanosensitive channel
MVFDVSVALTWILFLALFPIAFFWLRRAWRILVKRDFSEVAVKRGVPPPNPEKYAPYEFVFNLIAGVIVVLVIVTVLLGHLDYQTWTAIAGSTIWCKFFVSFALSRHAHMGLSKPKK